MLPGRVACAGNTCEYFDASDFDKVSGCAVLHFEAGVSGPFRAVGMRDFVSLSVLERRHRLTHVDEAVSIGCKQDSSPLPYRLFTRRKQPMVVTLSVATLYRLAWAHATSSDTRVG